MREKGLRDIYMSPKQQEIYYSKAHHVRVCAARRFGKTDGVIGPRIYDVQASMPRSTNLILGASRAQLLRRTVPAMLAAISRNYKLTEGVHFGLGKPPRYVPRPIINPQNWDSVLWFANGAIFQLVSLATIGSCNGMTTNHIIADECKFLPKNKIDGEAMQTLSGITHPLKDQSFSDFNPLYKGTLFASDASLTSRGNWLEKEESLLDEIIDDGPYSGRTYGWLQDQLTEYARFCSWYNETGRMCRNAGGIRIRVQQSEIDRVNAIAERMMAHDGEFRILPNWGKKINKAMLDMCVNYHLISPDDAELIYNREWLLTPEQDMRAIAILHSNTYKEKIRSMQRWARTYYRASTLDNVALLGQSYIDDMKRLLPPLIFEISILNRKTRKINDGFYANLDVDAVHGYVPDTIDPMNMASKVKVATHIVGGTAYHEEYNSVDFDRLSKLDDCSMDGDVQDDQQLYVALDYNAKINWIVTGQLSRYNGTECLNTLSSKFVKNDQMLPQLIEEWCRYYAPHRRHNNKVTFFYDATAKHRAYAVSKQDFKDIVIGIMQKHGWAVDPVDMKTPMGHSEKYFHINQALAGVAYPFPRFNRENNEALLIAMENTDVIKVGKDIKKYKAGEKLSESAQTRDGGESVPYELRTDGTDAWDSLFIGIKFYRNGERLFCAMPLRR